MKKLFLVIISCAFAIYLILYTALLSAPTTAFIAANMPVTANAPVNTGTSIIINASTKDYKDREYMLLNFIKKNLLSDRGEIYSSLKDKSTLSESVGLFMNYSITRNRKDLFDREFEFLTGELMQKGCFVSWKAGGNSIGSSDTGSGSGNNGIGGNNTVSGIAISCNALIDDLRIIRALLEANDRWGGKKYFDTAGFIQEGIFKNQVTDNNIYEFYDWSSGERNNRIPLCYIDLYTMDGLGVFNSAWSVIADIGLNVMKQGKIGGYSPFFYKYYNYGSSLYTADETFQKNSAISVTYSIYAALHLAEVNEDMENTRTWLHRQVDGGKLYAWYNPVTLKEVDDTESTAVYALAAVFSRKAGDNELYGKLIQRMLDFMITDKSSKYYGGFGNAGTGEFYAFDNLTALWALSLAGNQG